MWVLAPGDVGSVAIIHVDQVIAFLILIDGHVRPLGLVHVKIDMLAIKLWSQLEGDLLALGLNSCHKGDRRNKRMRSSHYFKCVANELFY